MAGLRTLHLPFAPVFHCKWTFYALFSLSIEGKLWGYKQKRLLKLSSIGTKWSSTLSIVWLKQPSSKLGYTISCSVCMATHLLMLDHTCQLTVMLMGYHGLAVDRMAMSSCARASSSPHTVFPSCCMRTILFFPHTGPCTRAERTNHNHYCFTKLTCTVKIKETSLSWSHP